MRLLDISTTFLVALAVTACAPINYTTGYSGPISTTKIQATYPAIVPSSIPPAPSFPAVGIPECNVGVVKQGPLEEEDIRACMDRNNGALQAIYQRSLRSDPTLKGAMTIKMKISPEGKIVDAEVEPGAKLPLDLTGKILERVKAVRFPGSPATWEGKYTFNFFPS